jgi:hypothetical protein
LQHYYSRRANLNPVYLVAYAACVCTHHCLPLFVLNAYFALHSYLSTVQKTWLKNGFAFPLHYTWI